MNAEASRPYQVTAYQLGQALHDYFLCPFNHFESSRKYVNRDECTRLRRLVSDAGKVLDWSLAQQVVPGLRTSAFDGTDRPIQAVQFEQTEMLDLLDLRSHSMAQDRDDEIAEAVWSRSLVPETVYGQPIRVAEPRPVEFIMGETR